MSSAASLPIDSFEKKHRAALERFVIEGLMTANAADSCTRMVTQYRDQCDNGTLGIKWHNVLPLDDKFKQDLTAKCSSLLNLHEADKSLSKVVILRLNGGLGTSMGCKGPKALIKVQSNASFLELVVRQVAAINAATGDRLPLVFMNSRGTNEPTRTAVAEIQQKLRGEHMEPPSIDFFVQPVFPRLDPATLFPSEPLQATGSNTEELWYPPGHAAVFQAFVDSGLAARFLEAGKRWVFVANVDNLGAWPDPNILAEIEKVVHERVARGEERPVFFMETTQKTPLDVKGGSPIQYKGKPFLLEAVMVPDDRKKDFEDIKRFELFNTGNLWIDLEAWVHMPPLSLPIMSNPKSVTLAHGETVNVLQLETGVGSALSALPSHVLVVPRSRFAPVKLTADLLRLRSDLFCIDERSGFLTATTGNLPEVLLSKEFAHTIDLDRRVKGTVSLKDAKRLILDGNILLLDGVKFVGDVEVHAHANEPLELASVYVDAKIE